MTHTLVIGGGIAGLSAAWALATDREVVLLEREAMLATHSSARNAQIWLPIDDDRSTGPLAVRSAQLWTQLLGSEPRWLKRCGAVAIVTADRQAAAVRGARRGGVTAAPIDRARLRELAPEVADLPGGAVALEVKGAGVFEPSEMMDTLAAACRARGVNMQTRANVVALELHGAEISGVRLADGTSIRADEVVLAAGAWASALAETIARPVDLVPYRRHLVLLEAQRASPSIVWNFAEPSEVYWRSESGGVLVSPCDQVASEPCLPVTDPCALEHLAERLAHIAPDLCQAPVRTSWACLRTFAPDRELVLGQDPAISGLAWFAGLGGRGMTIGLAGGELLATAMRGEPHPLLAGMRVGRSV